MDTLLSFVTAHAAQTDFLLMQARQVIGLVAAVLAALLAGMLGWHGTDRALTWRQRADD